MATTSFVQLVHALKVVNQSGGKEYQLKDRTRTCSVLFLWLDLANWLNSFSKWLKSMCFFFLLFSSHLKSEILEDS